MIGQKLKGNHGHDGGEELVHIRDVQDMIGQRGDLLVSLGGHGDDIGVRETLDVGGVYVDSRKPKSRMPASNPRLNVNITALSHAA